jgi:hypothetical protein
VDAADVRTVNAHRRPFPLKRQVSGMQSVSE